ncbi:beta strand repeat-containing protein, partial [Plastoroseomonas arctica]
TGVAPGAELRADATVLGQGGSIIVHSTEATEMAGAISARGGPQGGDGGFVEVSGERGFRVPGSIDAGAPQGQAGTVLFDPNTLLIANNGFTLPGVPDFNPAGDSLGFGAPPTDAVVTPTQIAAVTGDLLLQATSSIVVQDAVTKPQGSLTLQTAANGLIQINANVVIQAGNLTLIGNAIAFNALAQASGTVTLQNTGGTAPGNVTAGTNGRIVATTLTQTGALSFNAITLSGANEIATLGSLTAQQGIIVNNIVDLTVAGPVSLLAGAGSGNIRIIADGGATARNLTVNGSVNAGVNQFVLTANGDVTLNPGSSVSGSVFEGLSVIAAATTGGTRNPALPGALRLNGTINHVGDLTFGAGTGGISQQGGQIVVPGGTLGVASGADALLDHGAGGGAPNAVANIGSVNIPGRFSLDNGITNLTVTTASTIQAASIRIATEGTLTIAAGVGTLPSGLLTSPSGTISLLVNGLNLPAGPTTTPRVNAATVEIAPATPRAVQFALPDATTPTPGTLALNQQTLALINATDTLRIGGTTAGGTTATALTIEDNFDFAGGPTLAVGTLDLRSLGAITQAAGTLLGADILTGSAGGGVNLPNVSIGQLGDFSAGDNFFLSAGELVLAGLVSAPGRIVTLVASGSVSTTGPGRVTAAELRVSNSDGNIELAGANLLDRLGETRSVGTLEIVNAGPLMEIPAGATVQAADEAVLRATTGSITVNGTVRAPVLTLSAPSGTVAVNGNSAIATTGALLLAGDAVAVNGLVSSPVQVTVQGTSSASLAGTAQTPLLVVSAPAVTFGGLNVAGLTRLSLGTGGFASGGINTRQLAVLGGRGTLLNGTIAGVAGESAAALGERRNAQGVTEPSPPPNALSFLFNNCAIAVAGLCAPPPPVVTPPPPTPPTPPAQAEPGDQSRPDVPSYTVADNPRGLQAELDPAGQPAGLVRFPSVSLVVRPGRDTTEDRELAPPNVRAEDF